ncbi:hypothetical protein D3C84_733350 [compost metagenome]
MFQLRRQLRQGAAFAVSDLAVDGENPLQHFLGLQCRQHRLERVIHRQHVSDAAARGHWQNHLVAQGAFGQQIQHDFQCSGKRCLVYRCGDQQAIGVFNLLQQVDHLGAVEPCVQQVFGREVPYLVTHHLDTLRL